MRVPEWLGKSLGHNCTIKIELQIKWNQYSQRHLAPRLQLCLGTFSTAQLQAQNGDPCNVVKSVTIWYHGWFGKIMVKAIFTIKGELVMGWWRWWYVAPCPWSLHWHVDLVPDFFLSALLSNSQIVFRISCLHPAPNHLLIIPRWPCTSCCNRSSLAKC
jgi:hypothetical protein